jgi:predicted dienelactone hydrolase
MLRNWRPLARSAIGFPLGRSALVGAVIGGALLGTAPLHAGLTVLEELAEWRDKARNRTVPVAIYAPEPAETAGPLPVVLISHGFGETRTSHGFLGRHLAAAGYIVVAVHHEGSDAEAQQRGGMRALADLSIFLDRPGDISFALDRIGSGQSGSALIDGRADMGRVGVAGHSLGSTTALAMVGLTVRTPDDPDLSFRDPRIKAAVAMSPQVGGAAGQARAMGIHAGSWQPIDRPVMFLWGSRDIGLGALRDDPALRRIAYDSTNADPTYLVVLEGAEHHAFTETPPWYKGGERDPRHHGWIGIACEAFFDAQVNEESAAADWLQEQALAASSEGGLRQEHKSGTVSPAAGSTAQAGGAYDFAPLEAYIEEGISRHGLPGAAIVLIDRGGRLIYEKSFGGFTPETRVPIASASKWLAGATVMTLVDAGLIDFDAPVSDYLPEFRVKSKHKGITIRQTLAFTAGLPPHHRIQDDPAISQADEVAFIPEIPLEREPGTALIYGGLQMEIAGRVAEVVTGKPYRQIFQERLLDPLGMEDTRIANMVRRSPRNLDFKSANPLVPGGVETNARDYIRFVQMVLQGGVYDGRQILSPESMARMWTDQTDGVPIVRSMQPDDSYRYSTGCWHRTLDGDPERVVLSSEGALGTSAWVDGPLAYGGVFTTQSQAGQMRTFIPRLKELTSEILSGTTVTSAPAPAPAAASPGGAQGSQRAAEMFRRLDTDGDGMIDRGEIPQQARRMRENFDRLDRDGDGRLSQQEVQRVMARAGRGGQGQGQGQGSYGSRTTAEPAPSAPTPSSEPTTPAAEPQGGPHPVSELELLVLHDAERGKDLQIRVVFPADGERYPVVVYSHYSGGSKDEYGPLVRHWASHGYVVILPNHSDSPAVGGRRGADARRDWKDRPLDIAFILDALPRLEEEPALAGKVDASRVGVGGHYIGAYAASFLAGGTNQSGDDFLDDRVGAALLMSPQGRGQGLDESSWARIEMPMMVMTGSEDKSGRTGNPPEWRTEPFQFAPPGHKYLVFIEGLAGDYGGLVTREGGDGTSAMAGWVKDSTTAFWDAFLGGDESARASLTPSAWDETSGGKVALSSK